MCKKIVVIGPESTGKSTLSAQLAEHFGCFWCPEFAREYLTIHGADYSYGDLLKIAEGQCRMEDDYFARAQAAGHPFLFIDTDMYVMKVWSEYVFGKCDPFILNQIASRRYDLYLLCHTDLPWVKDELREYPDPQTRKELLAIYQDLLINQPVPWAPVTGNYEARLAGAITAVESLVQQP